jgi:hypothetical protein
MKIFKAPSSIYIHKIPQSERLNKKILDCLEARSNTPYIDPTQSISNQDWANFDWKGVPLYWKLLVPKVIECLKVMNKYDININNDKPLEIMNYWFQQYEQGDYQAKHHHPNSTYSSVYYVELPTGVETTLFNKEGNIKVPVKTGDLLVFPSHFNHMSPINKSDRRKTIISINLTTTT